MSIVEKFNPKKSNDFDTKLKEFEEKTKYNLSHSNYFFNLLKDFKKSVLFFDEPNDNFEVFSVELLFDIANTIYDANNDLKEFSFLNALEHSLTISKYIHDYKLYLSIIKLLASTQAFIDPIIIENIAHVFSDKNLIFSTVSYFLNKIKDKNENISVGRANDIGFIFDYLIAMRKYYVDDRSLYTSFIEFTREINLNKLGFFDREKIEKLIKKHVEEAKKANGIYDISEEDLHFFSLKVDEAGVTAASIQTLLDLAEATKNEIEIIYEQLKHDAKTVAQGGISQLENKAQTILKNFNTEYLKLLKEARGSLSSERDLILSDFKKEIEKLKQELAEYQLNFNIDPQAYSAFDTLLKNIEAKGGILSQIEDIQNAASKIKSLDISTITPENKPNVILVNGSEKKAAEEVINYEPIYYFDNSTKYKKRFQKLMERKKELEATGEVFHECFDDVLTIIIHNNVPYIYGPSGSGKSYMVEKQIPKILGIPLINENYISYKQEILGFNNAGNGDFVQSNFYRAFRLGNIIFFDEIDNSNPKEITILNPFYSKDDKSFYTFPNGVSIKRHPNFRIICAGNTTGDGNSVEYQTRQKLDESSLQRVWAVECDYDTNIDRKILENEPDWLSFVQCYRRAIEEVILSNELRIKSPGTFTSRDASDIASYLSDGAFDYKKLIHYKFIQTKGVEYLDAIIKKMTELKPIYADSENTEYQKLFEEFKSQVKEKARKLKC